MCLAETKLPPQKNWFVERERNATSHGNEPRLAKSLSFMFPITPERFPHFIFLSFTNFESTLAEIKNTTRKTVITATKFILSDTKDSTINEF